jgi:hypothetical protein
LVVGTITPHTHSDAGPWQPVNGNHQSLLGGWTPYVSGDGNWSVWNNNNNSNNNNNHNNDGDDDGGDGDSGLNDHQHPHKSETRVWGSFWGAPDVDGYTAEGGGCCHQSRDEDARNIIQFWRHFTIEVRTVLSSSL